MKHTHKVLDMTDHDMDGDTSGVFSGSYQECVMFINDQNSSIGYEIVPIIQNEDAIWD